MSSKIREELLKARKEYIDLIKAELIGPGSEFSHPDAEHELISVAPTSRYSVGILFPKGNIIGQDNDETLAVDNSNTAEDSDVVTDNSDELSVAELPSSGSVKNPDEMKDNLCDEDETLDEEVGMAAQFMPSSFGITFLAKGDCDSVNVNCEFATYRRAGYQDCVIPYLPSSPDEYTVPTILSHLIEYRIKEKAFSLKRTVKHNEISSLFEKDSIPENDIVTLKNIMYRFADYCKCGYVREPHSVRDYKIEFCDGNFVNEEMSSGLDGINAKMVALRRNIKDDIWSVTLMMVNSLEEVPAQPQHCLFQPVIKVNSENNNFIFIENNSNSDSEALDAEEQSLDLLYRNKKIYATGLGVATDWRIDKGGNGALWTDFFPMKEIPSMSFSLPENDLINDNELSMKYLSDLDFSAKDTKMTSMSKMVDLYRNWTAGLEKDMEALDERYKNAAVKNIEECKKAYGRMYEGIQTLCENDNAYRAFLLANRAMFMQRIHLSKQAEMAAANADRYPDDEEISQWLTDLDYSVESDSSCKWRPFQIAFLLMDINSIVDSNSLDRSIVDLIWFPTGGGKTEAYLGLTAFAIFYRRLAFPKESGGTTVMMRYTLRLLAAQQFTRAATLICACEFIRQDSARRRSKYPSYDLGSETISIGLWIGGTHIPNKNSEAKKHLDKLMGVSNSYSLRSEKDRHNKFQVLKCPWCGTKMVKDVRDNKLVGEWGYSFSSRGSHFYLTCPHEDCDFTNRLPIQIIDEELYTTPPTLLFGTVDKFAMLPWDGRIGAFFGINSHNRSPELIIQDELHLISGALGTIVGLFETAIDALCSDKGISPKIIASTATIRRAKEQCAVLYNRPVVQFPAPGLDASDSFFAKESVIDHEKGVYGRQYIGVMPSGKTKAMTEIRMMAALLQKAYTMDLKDEVKDKLWTLTVYFNSIKDLGKASTLVEDDVKDFIIRTANRMFARRRLIVSPDELTSRVSTTELNETLDKLEKVEYSQLNINNKKYASNILLATNMISVGIDVARLNVMLMVGQPKLTSEYIQASSRVGRSYPGVVFVQYDATKSRDRSHYERFKPYHESFYRFVEPTGATPFSKPARERALHAVLISIFRQKAGLINDNSAGLFDENYFEDKIDNIKEYVINRVEGIKLRSPWQTPEDIDKIEDEIKEFFDTWQRYVDECKASEPNIPLYFGRKFMVTPPGDKERRLMRQYNSTGKDISIDTLTSMRNVDSSVCGKIVIWGDNNGNNN